MLKSLIGIFGLLVAGCASSSNFGGTGTKSDESFSRASFAYEAARHARSSKSLEAYIVALEAMAAASTTDAQHKKSSSGEGASEKAGDGVTLDSLAKEARVVAGADTDAQNRINQIVNGAQAGSKGAAGGPKRAQDVVRGYSTDSYEVTFRGGQTAEVLVSGDGDSDLDLFIYDENGGLICTDDDATDDCYCRWTPRWTGSFTIEIKNLGMANRYVLLTN